mmetsp:Transcript_159982/g.294928  ORF Transcript_159982/g.294928 Transcript_159982/m.294928 type:complete len:265 (+) Transcript_159982:36-830(+)
MRAYGKKLSLTSTVKTCQWPLDSQSSSSSSSMGTMPFFTKPVPFRSLQRFLCPAGFLRAAGGESGSPPPPSSSSSSSSSRGTSVFFTKPVPLRPFTRDFFFGSSSASALIETFLLSSSSSSSSSSSIGNWSFFTKPVPLRSLLLLVPSASAAAASASFLACRSSASRCSFSKSGSSAPCLASMSDASMPTSSPSTVFLISTFRRAFLLSSFSKDSASSFTLPSGSAISADATLLAVSLQHTAPMGVAKDPLGGSPCQRGRNSLA